MGVSLGQAKKLVWSEHTVLDLAGSLGEKYLFGRVIAPQTQNGAMTGRNRPTSFRLYSPFIDRTL